MIATQLAPRTALLVACKSDLSDLESLVHGMGYVPVSLGGTDLERNVPAAVSICLIDLRENGDALRAVRAVRTQHPLAVIIGIADPERPATSTDAIRAGIFDVLPRPATTRDLEALIVNAREQRALPSIPVSGTETQSGIVAVSSAMRLVMDVVHRAAPGRCGVLICGERGAGREMVARAIHALEPNRRAPFVAVDCTPSAEDVELRLFGLPSRRGGAARERRTLERITSDCALRRAQGGMLFLENVAELPARAQVRLVRILRDREAYVGAGSDVEPVDVRPIAKVEGAVETALEEGRLRVDLYERLALVRIDVPALRQRREDIPLLAAQFLKELCRRDDKPLKTLTRSSLTLLAALPWKGNAPELWGLLERLVAVVPQGLIRLEDVLAHVQLEGSVSPAGFDATLRQARARFERDYIAAVLQHQHGRIAEAAKLLGIQRTNLYRKMRRLNLMHGKSRRDA